MFKVKFDRDICTQCFDCVNGCPQSALVQIDDYPAMRRGRNTCTGCEYCEAVCAAGAIRVESYVEEYAGGWTASSRRRVAEISQIGRPIISGYGTPRRVVTFDDLAFVPAQLARFPLLEHEEVSTELIIGKRAARSLTLPTPILIGAMSFGAISFEAKVAIARAAAAVGTLDNTGEGGMLPEEREGAKYLTVQYSTGRFGMSERVLRAADAVEIKVGQGAKPGMGGHLPRAKITEEIAQIRGIDRHRDAVSPARHLDINSAEDLRDRVAYLRELTNGVPIILKIAAGDIERDLDVAVFAEVDAIAIDGTEGGTAAAPEIAKDHVGVPLAYAIPRAHRYLTEIGKRDQLTLIASGGLRDAADIAKVIALGADGVYVATALLVAMGCTGCRSCHRGNCPVGIATQVPFLRKRLNVAEATERVINYLRVCTAELAMIARMTGKTSLAHLSPNDLCALTPEAACIEGVRPAYQYSPPPAQHLKSESRLALSGG